MLENHYNYNFKCLFGPTYVLVPQSCALVKHNPNCITYISLSLKKRLQTLNTPEDNPIKVISNLTRMILECGFT